MKKNSCALTLLLLSNAFFCWAQPGSLDPTFSNDGKVTTKFNGGDYGRSIAIQTDGKIIFAGFDGNYDFATVRYRTNGTIDTTFGIGGKVTTDFGAEDYALSAAIQKNGKIVLAGFSGEGSEGQFALTRYNQNGSTDSSFGLNGKVLTPFGTNSYDQANAMVLQQNGKIVVSGYSSAQTNYYAFAVARYLANGQLDKSFGTGGKVIINNNNNVNVSQAHSLAILSNGKILIAGSVEYSNITTDFQLVQLTANGRIDSSFGTNGIALTDFGGYDDVAYSVKVLSDGKILEGGYASPSSTVGDFGLVGLNADGKIDTTFGTKGKTLTDFGSGNNAIYSINVQSNGKIVAAGYASNGTNIDFALARYTEWGKTDNSFGTKGKVLTDFSGGTDYGLSSALQPDGKIVLGGWSSAANGTGSLFAAARYIGDSTSKIGDYNFSEYQANKNDFKALTHISLSPNPVNDILRIQGLPSSVSVISVFDISGKKIQNVIVSGSSFQFDVKELPLGLYFVTIRNGENTSTFKFVKE